MTREERAVNRIAKRLVQALMDIERSVADPESILEDARIEMGAANGPAGAVDALAALRKHYLGE